MKIIDQQIINPNCKRKAIYDIFTPQKKIMFREIQQQN